MCIVILIHIHINILCCTYLINYGYINMCVCVRTHVLIYLCAYILIYVCAYILDPRY